MSISIIIPNYNGAELLKKNLPKVLAATGNAEVIVVDDASIDASLDILRTFDVKVVVNEKNMGFSSTANRGVKEARGDIVVLLNTDVAPEKNFLEPLMQHFKDPNVFAVGCMDKSVDGEKIVLRGRGIGSWQRGFFVHGRGEVDRTNTLWVSGGSGAFRKSLWEKLGCFDELYNPYYWEDIDLSYRALKAGYTILFESKSIVTHEHNKGAIKQLYSLFRVKTIAYRNQFIFVWKNATDPDMRLLHILWLPIHCARAILRGDLPFFLGLLQAFLRSPKIIQSSLSVQKLFKLNDKEVVAEFVK